ncbi:MAG: hypothetical protein HQ478_14745, partial [Chloroflexi bacterium]|nr:hypothetical protein [Chloroflexota bacterium]
MVNFRPMWKRGFLLWMAATIVAAILAAAPDGPRIAADGHSTTFDATSVDLPNIGDTARVTVSGAGLDSQITGIGLVLTVPSFLRVENPSCAGLLSSGTVVNDRQWLTGPTWLFSCNLGTPIPANFGGLLEFDVRRIDHGFGELNIDSDTWYKTNERLEFAPGATNSLQIIHTESLGGDYGDAPDPTYPSSLASRGARHANTIDLYLG